MIGKARRYKWLDFTDSVQVASQRSNWYSYIIQNNVRNTVLRTNLTDKANFHWWYASETLAWPRLFSFEWKVIGTTKAQRHEARSLLLNALKPEGNPNIINRGFYDLEFQDDALRAIAKKAIDRNTGARGLRSIVESVMMETMYEIPSRSDIKKCVITKDTIINKSEPKLVLTKKPVSDKKENVS